MKISRRYGCNINTYCFNLISKYDIWLNEEWSISCVAHKIWQKHLFATQQVNANED